jgi:hypothetical protein
VTRCPRCHHVRYAVAFQLSESLRQSREYGPPCRCTDAPRVRDAFDVLDKMAKGYGDGRWG